MSDGLRTWLITGTSRGLGRAFAEVALEAGDAVAATARHPETLDDLAAQYGERFVALRLDVADREADFAAVEEARRRLGRIDVLVNNAGYGLSGGVEEVTEEQARRQMEVNFFGALWLTQAVLPIMRKQGSGHIFQISSIGGVGAFPSTGLYHASKWALEGVSETLAQEVAPFGIKVTIVEPGAFRTDWFGDSLTRAAPMPEYDEVLQQRRQMLSGTNPRAQPGDPRKAGEALLKVLASDEPPLRLLLGNEAAVRGPAIYRDRLEEWARWEDVARSADYSRQG